MSVSVAHCDIHTIRTAFNDMKVWLLSLSLMSVCILQAFHTICLSVDLFVWQFCLVCVSGINKMIADGHYTDAYPLHEVSSTAVKAVTDWLWFCYTAFYHFNTIKFFSACCIIVVGPLEAWVGWQWEEATVWSLGQLEELLQDPASRSCQVSLLHSG